MFNRREKEYQDAHVTSQHLASSFMNTNLFVQGTCIPALAAFLEILHGNAGTYRGSFSLYLRTGITRRRQATCTYAPEALCVYVDMYTQRFWRALTRTPNSTEGRIRGSYTMRAETFLISPFRFL